MLISILKMRPLALYGTEKKDAKIVEFFSKMLF